MTSGKDNRRAEKRKAAEIHCELVAGGLHLQGRSKNLSGNGVLMTVENGFPPDSLLNQSGTVWLDFGEDILDLSCHVVRLRGVDVAVMFTEADVDKIIVLKKILHD